jgi:hypothetical protein
MRRLASALWLAITALAQTPTPGTVTTVTTVTITAAAGTAPEAITCTFTSTPSQVVTGCAGAGATLSTTFAVPIPSPGTIGTFGLSGNIITWSFQPYGPTVTSCPSGVTSGTCWQVVANGTSKSGAF